MTDRSSRGSLARSRLVERAGGVLMVIAVLALATLLLVSFVGVILRYVFDSPILGANEIVQLASVVLVVLALPLAAQREIHIRVDVFDTAIGRIGRLVGDVLSRSLAGYLLAMLGLRAWRKMLDAYEYGDATNMLQIPEWPFYALLVLGAALYGLILVLQLVDVLRAGASRHA